MVKYSDIEVQYIDGYGSDILVVNAARVSFHKNSTYLSGDEHPIDDDELKHPLLDRYKAYLASLNRDDFLAGYPVDDWTKAPISRLYYGGIGPRGVKAVNFKDFRLIHFLAKKHHWTPFGHGSFTLRIKAPMNPIANQLKKHQVGLVWNEVSRRYYDGPVELYRMDYKKAGENKRVEGIEYADEHPDIRKHEANAIKLYEEMLASGVAAEDARTVLPQNMMTEWYWSGSVAAFMRVCALRVHKDTQRQTREVANKIADILKEKVPVSYLAHFGDR